jgi:hypothetical protein
VSGLPVFGGVFGEDGGMPPPRERVAAGGAIALRRYKERFARGQLPVLGEQAVQALVV